jgi:hypothetical protein
VHNLTPEQLEIATKTETLFYPFSASARKRMLENNGRFAHYSTAENALKILNSRRIWMRNATCMSDYREVSHGFDALDRYLNNSASKERFVGAINTCSQRWSHLLRQGAKVDSPMQRTTHHEDAETVFG